MITRGPLESARELPGHGADAHTPAGIAALELPPTFPFECTRAPVAPRRCQQLGVVVKERHLRGVRARSAQSRDGAGRELAWFPATAPSRARRVVVLDFDTWYWG